MQPKVEAVDRTELVQQDLIDSVPSILVATLPKLYPELQNTWDEGEQLTDTSAKIISRTFTELQFQPNANFFVFEDFGFGDTIADRYGYRVHLPFEETEYYSADNELYENFSKWEVTVNGWFQQIIYRQEIIAQPRWERPIDYASATLGVCPIGDVDPTPTDTGKDEYTFVPVPVGGEYPVTSPPLDEMQGGYCFRYENLPIPFVLTLDVGRALGAVVQADGAFTLELGDGTTYNPISNGTVTDPILLVQKSLRITFAAPDQDQPTFVQIDLYGEEFERSYLPGQLDTEPEFCHHIAGTPFENRLLPPGKTFPTNFWNNQVENNTLEDYSNRQTQEPGALV